MKVAVITMAYNEAINLPIWFRYYASQVGASNLFVIDHGSSDGSTDIISKNCNILRIPRHEEFDEVPRTYFVNKLQHALLQYYDAVIYTDTDEIIVADPLKYENLNAYLLQAAPVSTPVGLHVFQAPDDNPIDLLKPISMQRRYCQFYTAMCKPTIVQKPVNWSLGFHSADEIPHFAEDVYLFHLKSIDKAQSLRRLESTRATVWSESNLAGAVGFHHRSDDAFHIMHFFDAPAHELERSTDLTFNFSDDIQRLKQGLVEVPGSYHITQFAGKVAVIPDHIVGLF